MYKIIGADQKEYGPVSADQMRQWITEGRVNGQTMVFADAMGQWRPLSTVPEFASYFASIPTGAPPPLSAPRSNVPNYLVQSILVTLCCCLPFGVVAIVYAAQVNSKLQIGDYQGAVDSSNKARTWCIIALIVGIVSGALGGILQFTLTPRSIHF